MSPRRRCSPYTERGFRALSSKKSSRFVVEIVHFRVFWPAKDKPFGFFSTAAQYCTLCTRIVMTLKVSGGLNLCNDRKLK